MVPPARNVTGEELARQACWMALHGCVYDLTGFLEVHPGGRAVLEKVLGKDGTKSFQAVHPQSLLQSLPAGVVLIGKLSSPALPSDDSPDEAVVGEQLMQLSDVINLHDFEVAAQQRMTVQGYAYYASAACDEMTKQENEAAFSRAWLRPRIMVDVHDIDLSCSVLNVPLSLPVFLSPAAMAGFAHEDAEPALVRAAASQSTLQIISYNASRDLEEITAARAPGQFQWYQIYINPDRAKAEKMIQRVVASGCQAIVVTVDSNVVGRRERDMRVKGGPSKALAASTRSQADAGNTSSGVVASLGSFTDARLSWKDVSWLRNCTKLPLLLKGIQTGEDAVLAAQHGIDAIIISNHGGRQLDHVRPTFDILEEVMDALNVAGLRERIEVYVDGGIRRGTDVYKALALGAKAVGIGRPHMYALTFGQEGVERCLQILRDELTNCMQLMGRCSLSEIRREDVVFKPTGSSGSNHRGRVSRL